MRFALLGDHPDGLDMARALVASGRHHLAAYTGQPSGAESLGRWGITVKPSRDVEEVLAYPGIEAVIVASPVPDRPAHLRRALQSERHVLCVHPADESPDIAYEAALIQGDTRRVLLPLLPETLHPAFIHLANLLKAKDGPLGSFELLQMERGLPSAGLIDSRAPVEKLWLPGWDVLRNLGGEITEIFALAAGEDVTSDEPVLLSGRFERRGLFQQTFLPGQGEAPWHLALLGSYGRVELLFSNGWPGPARLVWQDETGAAREEQWQTWNPWPALVEVFEEAVAHGSHSAERAAQSAVSDEVKPAALRTPRSALETHPAQLTWQTAVRCLELDEAVRRSLERRRVSTLEHPEATEEVGFKGTMTLVGCGLLWLSVLLLILSAWIPWLKYWWAVVPLLIVFLSLQLLRWFVPRSRQQETHGMPR